MNRREACDWVHEHLIMGEMPFDDLVAAFTALAGHAPSKDDRPDGLFRGCCEMVASLTGVSDRGYSTTTVRPRRPLVT